MSVMYFDMHDYCDTNTLVPDTPTTGAFCDLPTFTFKYTNLRVYCIKQNDSYLKCIVPYPSGAFEQKHCT